jgi:leucyl aminopeptidase
VKIELATMKSWTGKVWAALMFEGDKTPLGIAGLEGVEAAGTAKSEKFEGKPKQTVLLRRNDEKLIVAGLGKRKEYSLERARAAAAKLLKRCEEIGATSVGLTIPDAKDAKGDLGAFVGALIEGAMISSYRFDKWRTPKADEAKPVAELALVFANPKNKTVTMQKAVDAAVAKSLARSRRRKWPRSGPGWPRRTA